MNVFITGTSSGIGRELTVQLLREGQRVWGIARTQSKMDEFSATLANATFRYSICDVADPQACRAVLADMAQNGFVPDVVVLNAAVYEKDVGEGLDREAFQKTFAINVDGALFWVEQFLPLFLRRGFGHFIAISSTSALRPGYSSVSYPASKAALSMAFRGLRLNFAHTPVLFSTIHFGPVETRLWSGRLTFLVPQTSSAARFIRRVIASGGKSYFFPFLSTLLLRCTLFLPDLWFSTVTRLLKKVRK